MKEHLIFAAMSPLIIVVLISAGIGVGLTFIFLIVGEAVARKQDVEYCR